MKHDTVTPADLKHNAAAILDTVDKALAFVAYVNAGALNIDSRSFPSNGYHINRLKKSAGELRAALAQNRAQGESHRAACAAIDALTDGVPSAPSASEDEAEGELAAANAAKKALRHPIHSHR